jgi:predicted RNA-binding protein with PIN domain
VSLEYIIDGCNVVYHASFAQHVSRKQSDNRISLCEYISMKRLCGSRHNRVTVVFDGFPPVGRGNTFERSDLDVLFSQERTGDETIRRLVEKKSQPKNVVVVSDDKEIGFFVKGLGARWMKVEEFIGPPREEKPRKPVIIKPELSYQQVRQINTELSELWLKKKK